MRKFICQNSEGCEYHEDFKQGDLLTLTEAIEWFQNKYPKCFFSFIGTGQYIAVTTLEDLSSQENVLLGYISTDFK